jgi:hypothetical protein
MGDVRVNCDSKDDTPCALNDIHGSIFVSKYYVNPDINEFVLAN